MKGHVLVHTGPCGPITLSNGRYRGKNPIVWLWPKANELGSLTWNVHRNSAEQQYDERARECPTKPASLLRQLPSNLEVTSFQSMPEVIEIEENRREMN